MISSWRELHDRSMQPIHGSQHVRWVPSQELLPECTPAFREVVVKTHAAYRAVFAAEQMAYQRRYIKVVRRKYLARRRRKS